MKCAFVDFDGVLNTPTEPAGVFENPSWPPWSGWDPESGSDWAKMLCPTRVARLSRVCDVTGARIVISSSWGAMASLGVLRAALHLGGLAREHALIADVTPRNQRGVIARDRMQEIRWWLDENPHVTTWAIVDDTSFDGFAETGRFVKTETCHGLQDEHVERLIALLGVKESPCE